jgi:hypothetical protein
MKKLFLLVVLQTIAMMAAFGSAGAALAGENTMEPAGDVAVINAILAKTYATTIIFTGGNEKWDCSYTVRESLSPGAGRSGSPRVKVVLTPKVAYYKYCIRHFNYLITTSKGYLAGAKWLRSGKSITLETDRPIPQNDETIGVYLSKWHQTTFFTIKSSIPDGTISPRQAFCKAWAVYFDTYGTYPTTLFTFRIEFIDRKYWLVSWDDNDGIGGESFLLVNAFTGEAGAIKVDE